MSEPATLAAALAAALAVARRAPRSAGIRISGPLDMIALDHIRAALNAADGAPFVIRSEQARAIDPASAESGAQIVSTAASTTVRRTRHATSHVCHELTGFAVRYRVVTGRQNRHLAVICS